MTNEAIRQKVETLLTQMTLEEKAAQMVQVPYTVVGREESLRWAKLGAGSFLHVLGDDAREIQQAALHESRLGIPVIFGIDAIHGHGLKHEATIFPSQLAAACSWDPAIVEEMGRVTAREVASDGLHWTFSPVCCLGRDTRWGRIDETFGEDPYLSGEMTYGIVKGYQGESLDAPDSILACAKHYIGYGEAMGARDAMDTQMTYRKMKEVFLPPFKRAVDAGCATFMTAYGSIDGHSFTADPKTMKTILRDELGFDGFVVTDWNNCESLMTQQFVAASMEDAAVQSAEAGNDMIMSTLGFYEAAISAVKSGKMAESVLDEAVRHILTVKFRMNLFGKPEKEGVPGCIGCQEHRDAALRAARRRASSELTARIGEELRFLDMPRVHFDVRLSPLEGKEPYRADGGDDVEFLISTNPGEPPLPMIRIASGGELSRIMLAIKSVLSGADGVPTLIFDEVDTGVSGKTSRKIGIKLKTIARGAQVLCVTHSAQIVSLADHHYYIYKEEVAGRTETRVRELAGEERVEEIARILGGMQVTDAQRESARELMKESWE